MLNKNNERELAYLVKVENITPMNADRLECAHIGGWHCVVGKGEFKVGDPAVYFEIDSQLPDVAPFSEMEFLRSKHFKIKTQKIRGEYSQGLLMPVSAWGWSIQVDGSIWMPEDGDHGRHYLDDESRFLTNRLNVTYAVAEDNSRKASVDKYKKMSQRHPDLFRKPLFRWLMRRTWGKKLLFIFFGKKKDKKNEFPAWVKKTDEERIQNCPWLLNDTSAVWIATEKIDGSSTTFTMKGFGKKRQYVVCSRNVAFDKPDKKCYYDTNIYIEMSEKYSMEEKLSMMLEDKKKIAPDIDFVTIQAETYGEGIQKRGYIKDHDMAIFNIIFGYKDGSSIRLNPRDGKVFADKYNLPFVPVIGELHLPNDCDAVVAIAGSEPSKIDGGKREGLVFRSFDGVKSFKAVDPEFLLKYHG